MAAFDSSVASHRIRAMMRILVPILLGSCGGDPPPQDCSLMFKGLPLYTVKGGKEFWHDPAGVCRLISKAISESPEDTRRDLFGMSASAWDRPLPCDCKEK